MHLPLSKRAPKGETLVDLPLALTVLFFLLFIPCLNFVSCTARCWYFRMACLEAAHRAARGLTYTAAKQIVNTQITNYINAGHIGASKINSQQLVAIVQERSTGNSQEFSAPPVPMNLIDSNKYQYFYELRSNADIPPFLTYVGPWFGNIPALTGPSHFSINCRQMVEHPAGLSQ